MKATCLQEKEKVLQIRKGEEPTETLGFYLLKQTYLSKSTYFLWGGYRDLQGMKIKQNNEKIP